MFSSVFPASLGVDDALSFRGTDDYIRGGAFRAGNAVTLALLRANSARERISDAKADDASARGLASAGPESAGGWQGYRSQWADRHGPTHHHFGQGYVRSNDAASREGSEVSAARSLPMGLKCPTTGPLAQR
jgi:hypothetical protein